MGLRGCNEIPLRRTTANAHSWSPSWGSCARRACFRASRSEPTGCRASQVPGQVQGRPPALKSNCLPRAVHASSKGKAGKERKELQWGWGWGRVPMEPAGMSPFKLGHSTFGGTQHCKKLVLRRSHLRGKAPYVQLLSGVRTWKSHPTRILMISGIMALVPRIQEGMVTAPGFHMRVRQVHVFLIGLLSKPCACHDGLNPPLSPSRSPVSLLVSLRQTQLLKGEMRFPLLPTRFLSYDARLG